MTKEETKSMNSSAHLEGIINQMDIHGEKDGTISAWVVIGTMDMIKKDADVTFGNAQLHMVKVAGASGEEARSLEELSRKDFGRERVCVTVDGTLKTAQGDVTFVLVSPKDFKITDHIQYKDNRKVALRGEIAATSVNDNYATMTVDLDGARVRVIMSRERQPKMWSDIAAGKIRKGDKVSASGTMRTQKFTDGGRTIIKMIVDARRSEKLTLTQKKTEARKNRPAMGIPR